MHKSFRRSRVITNGERTQISRIVFRPNISASTRIFELTYRNDFVGSSISYESVGNVHHHRLDNVRTDQRVNRTNHNRQDLGDFLQS